LLDALPMKKFLFWLFGWL